jgi:hypothetical protein
VSDPFWSWGTIWDWAALAQTLATLIALWFAWKAAEYGAAAVKQGREAAKEAAEERASRRLADMAEAVAALNLQLQFANPENIRPAQIQLRALLVATGGHADFPRTLELADAAADVDKATDSDDIRRAAGLALACVKPSLDEIRAIATSKHVVVRVRSHDQGRAQETAHVRRRSG